MAEMDFLVKEYVGPNVDRNAQIKVSIIITKNCPHGKKTDISSPRNRLSCSVKVYPTIIPIITPMQLLANTKIIDS